VTDQPSITCPVCKRTSYNPSDVAEGYCGACHDFTGRPREQLELAELLNTDHCELCQEPITLLDVEHGNVAEMFDPPVGDSVICHVSCGQNEGLVVA
jgi:hypothetical protein